MHKFEFENIRSLVARGAPAVGRGCTVEVRFEIPHWDEARLASEAARVENARAGVMAVFAYGMRGTAEMEDFVRHETGLVEDGMTVQVHFLDWQVGADDGVDHVCMSIDIVPPEPESDGRVSTLVRG